MFFVLTTGRSGSKSLASFLSTSQRLLCLHEPEPVLLLESRRFLYGTCSREEIVAILKKTRRPLLDGKEYGESNQCLSFLVPALLEAFPGCKFVWLARDGRNVVSSLHSLGWYDERYRHKSVWTENLLEADRAGQMAAREWAALGPFEKCCWYWQFTNSTIRRHLEGLEPGRWMILRLEEIGERAGELCSFLGAGDTAGGFPWTNIKKESMRLCRYAGWSQEQRHMFEQICREEMDFLYPGWQYQEPPGEDLGATWRRKLLGLFPEDDSPPMRLAARLAGWLGVKRPLRSLYRKVLGKLANRNE